MRVRRGDLDDVPALAALNREVQDPHVEAEPHLYRPADGAEVEAWLRERLSAGTIALIAEDDAGVAIGYALLQEVRRPRTPVTYGREFLLVDELAVVAARRRSGCARALMDAAAEVAVGLGLEWIELDVRAKNHGAIAFYDALGFAPQQHRLARRLDVTRGRGGAGGD